MRVANPEAVKRAIDDAADVGFEMVILSFGSGFNIENDSPDYIASGKRWQTTLGTRTSKSVATRCSQVAASVAE